MIDKIVIEIENITPPSEIVLSTRKDTFTIKMGWAQPFNAAQKTCIFLTSFIFLKSLFQENIYMKTIVLKKVDASSDEQWWNSNQFSYCISKDGFVDK